MSESPDSQASGKALSGTSGPGINALVDGRVLRLLRGFRVLKLAA